MLWWASHQSIFSCSVESEYTAIEGCIIRGFTLIWGMHVSDFRECLVMWQLEEAFVSDEDLVTGLNGLGNSDLERLLQGWYSDNSWKDVIVTTSVSPAILIRLLSWWLWMSMNYNAIQRCSHIFCHQKYVIHIQYLLLLMSLCFFFFLLRLLRC